MEVGDCGHPGRSAAGPVEEECHLLSDTVTAPGQPLVESIVWGRESASGPATLMTAPQALGISGRYSALILTAFLSGANFTPGGRTEEVG